MGSISQVVQELLRPAARFDPVTTFLPVVQTTTSPKVLIVPADSPIKTIKDLEAAVRAKPGQLNYGSGGIGTAAHIAGSTWVNVLEFDAVRQAFNDTSLRAAIEAGDAEVELSASPAEFAAFMKAETAKWARLIQVAGVKAD